MSLRQRFSQASIGLRLFLLVSLGSAVVVGAVFAGLLDRFSGAGGVSRDLVLQAVLLYWALSGLALGVIASWQTRRLQLLLAVLSLVFSFVVVEVGVRVLELPAGVLHWKGIPSRTQHHLYVPNTRMYAGVYEGSTIFVTTNEDGLRSEYSRQSFRSYGTRVAVLGDSFTFGFGVRHDQAVPFQLEKMLRERLGNEDLAVLNAGVVSYAPLLEKLLFENIVRHYEPDLVLLMLDPTDIGDNLKYSNEAQLEDGHTVFPRQGPECGESGELAYYGAVAEILTPVYESLAEAFNYPFKVIGSRLGLRRGKDCGYDYYDFKVKIGGVTETTRFFHYRHPLRDTHPYFDSVLEHISATAAAARAIGADFLLVVSPRFHHWNPKESPNNWEFDMYGLEEPYQYEYFRYFEQARDRVDYPIFDLLPAFQATEEFPLVFRDDPHWNPVGNAFAADKIASYLTQHKLIEKR